MWCFSAHFIDAVTKRRRLNGTILKWKNWWIHCPSSTTSASRLTGWPSSCEASKSFSAVMQYSIKPLNYILTFCFFLFATSSKVNYLFSDRFSVVFFYWQWINWNSARPLTHSMHMVCGHKTIKLLTSLTWLLSCVHSMNPSYWRIRAQSGYNLALISVSTGSSMFMIGN